MIRVSIVEDNDDIRNALRVLINGSEGFECKYTYRDGRDAVLDLPSREIDVILMDINMPVMNGIECMSKLRIQMPQTQFMMCTVYDDDENIFMALKNGATGYILKSTSPTQILEALHELLRGGSPMSTEIARKVVASFSSGNKRATREVELLTAREREILDLMAKGFLYKEIADRLTLSTETVKKHIHHIYEKLQVNTRVDALNKAFPR